MILQINQLSVLIWKNVLLLKRTWIMNILCLALGCICFLFINQMINFINDNFPRPSIAFSLRLQNHFDPLSLIFPPWNYLESSNIDHQYHESSLHSSCQVIGLSPPSYGREFIKFINSKSDPSNSYSENFKIFDNAEAAYKAYSQYFNFDILLNDQINLPEELFSICGYISFDNDILTSQNPSYTINLHDFSRILLSRISGKNYNFFTPPSELFEHYKYFDWQVLVEEFILNLKLSNSTTQSFSESIDNSLGSNNFNMTPINTAQLKPSNTTFFGINNPTLFVSNVYEKTLNENILSNLDLLIITSLLILGLVIFFQLFSIISYEKRNGLTNFIMSMGVPPTIHYISWIIPLGLWALISSLIFSIVMKITITPLSSVHILTIVIFCIQLSYISFGLFICELFGNSINSKIVVVVLVFVGQMTFNLLLTIDSFTAGILLKFYPLTNLFYFIYNVFRSEILLIGFTRFTQDFFFITFDPIITAIVSVLNLIIYTILTIITYKIRTKSFFFQSTKQTSKTETALEDKVSISNLTKYYKRNGTKISALNNLSLDINKNEIVCLLGPNGAGKTTLIKILTGEVIQSSGTISIFGNSERSHIRDSLGVCQQFDPLWDQLTVYEHIKLFSLLKGAKLKGKTLHNHIITILQDLNLSDKIHNRVKTLSGGMKRRVSIAKAFSSNAKLVILDEPSAGLDPMTRQKLWPLIKKMKKYSTILISTHYINEAEVLGERIAILDSGELKAYGTSSELKSLYNLGFEIVFSKLQNLNFADKFKDILSKHDLSNNVTETNEQAFVKTPLSISSKLTEFYNEFKEPIISKLTRIVDIRFASLTDIFFLLIKSKDESFEEGSSENSSKKNSLTNLALFTSLNLANYSSLNKHITRIWSMIYKRILLFLRSPFKIALYYLLIPILTLFALLLLRESLANFSSGKAVIKLDDKLLNNPASAPSNTPSHLMLTHDGSIPEVTPYFEQLVPEVWSDVHTSTMAVTESEHTDSFSAWVSITFDYMDHLSEEEKRMNLKDSFTIGSYSIMANENLQHVDTPIEVSRNNSKSVVSAFDYTTTFAYCNPAAIYSGPIYVKNFLRVITNAYNLNYTTEPSYGVLSVFDASTATQVVSMVLPTFLILIPALLVSFLTSENQSGLKHLQFMNMISPTIYYLCNGFFDMITTLINTSLIILFIYFIFDNFFSPTDTEFSFYFLITCLLFCVSCVPYTYFLCSLSKSVMTNYSVVIILNLFFLIYGMFAGLLTPQKGILMTSNETLQNLYSFANILGALSPSYQMTRLLMLMALNMLYNTVLPDVVIYKSDYIRPQITMIIQTVVYYFLCIIYDKYRLCGTFYFLLPRRENINNIQLQTINSVTSFNNNSDMSLESSNINALKVESLNKTYRRKWCKKTRALNNASFKAYGGRILCLLGENGSGKSTLINILTKLVKKNSGKITYNEYNIDTNPQSFINRIGLCSQFSTLWESLTCLDHLKLFAMFHGYRGKEFDLYFRNQLKALFMPQYRDVKSTHLSGGTQRKLNVLISLIGEKPIILLDEPSTGLDPLSRQQLITFLVNTINNNPLNPVIIMSTHAMDDVNLVSDRLVLLEKGNVLIDDSISNLKERYITDMEIDVKFNEPSEATVQELLQFLEIMNTHITRDQAKDVFDALNSLTNQPYTQHSSYEDSLELFPVNKNEKISVQEYLKYWILIGNAQQLITFSRNNGYNVQLQRLIGNYFTFSFNLEHVTIVTTFLETLKSNPTISANIHSISITRNSIETIIQRVLVANRP